MRTTPRLKLTQTLTNHPRVGQSLRVNRPPPTPHKIRMTCVKTKTRKIGTSDITDSFTPRRFISTMRPMAIIDTISLCSLQLGGRKLKTASAPEAMEMVMVRM